MRSVSSAALLETLGGETGAVLSPMQVRSNARRDDFDDTNVGVLVVVVEDCLAIVSFSWLPGRTKQASP